MENFIPKPILFNCWKHHQEFIMGEIRKMKVSKDLSVLKDQLKKIGDSTTDLYVGHLNLDRIATTALSFLEQKNIINKEAYLKWIKESSEEYRTVPFPDESVWVFKIGIEEGKYVHIHPGRKVPHTLRAKANVLKTAIAVNAKAFLDQSNPLDIELINWVRKDLINLDPIKFVTLNQELGRIIYDFAIKLGTLK